ncbi:hypothetical protein [Azospirillum sp. TSO22-1]|uniref:hypothetical protein n=1 Tax=Azospirillum sp. TSO22-1 TaxID=716789 RepID=UPI000D6193DA|nr:hypothetical protein [Azospirillum sp. TSO22-1]PWC40158.1 hypothetical protein TSO221_25615 [Azospirillum sp. TSO22-1]
MASVNPEHSTALRTATARESLSLLNAATGAMDTPAMMRVTGNENVAAQQKDLFDTQQRTGATSDESIEKMLKAPATGLMHVSDMARISAGWSPVILTDNEANSKAYEAYLNKVVQFPLVTLNYAQRQTLKRETSDWNTLINAIADTFVGIADKDRGAIITGLKNLAQAASSTMETTQKTSLFCQNAINAADNVYEFYLYNSTCTFYEKSGKGYDTKQNDFDVLQVKLTLLMPLWTRANVAKIIGQTSSSLDNWLNDNSSSLKGTKPIPALQ